MSPITWLPRGQMFLAPQAILSKKQQKAKADTTEVRAKKDLEDAQVSRSGSWCTSGGHWHQEATRNKVPLAEQLHPDPLDGHEKHHPILRSLRQNIAWVD